MDSSARIVASPDVLHGKPRIRGTRIPVEQVLGLLSEGISAEEIQTKFYPDLAREDILACVGYARDIVSNEEIAIVAGS